MEQEHPHQLPVTRAEDGMKLLRFLERRLDDSAAQALHKWIRTGQVRINGKRSKPFALLKEDDVVRIPPFAVPRPLFFKSDANSEKTILPKAAAKRATLPIIGSKDGYLVLNKPAGLAVQGGSGTRDSVAARLKDAFADHPFIPAPLHRLDKHTSGLLLVGTTQHGTQWLSAAFQSDTIHKEYLAVVQGAWPWDAPCLLLDHISNERAKDGQERMVCLKPSRSVPLPPTEEALAAYTAEQSRTHPAPALLAVRCLQIKVPSVGPYQKTPVSLLQIRLFTGKKHQIRVQLAHQGFPIIGDNRYNGTPHHPMLLHAMRLCLPDGTEWLQLPAWPEPFQALVDAEADFLASVWKQ